jgi:hypothetical protein
MERKIHGARCFLPWAVVVVFFFFAFEPSSSSSSSSSLLELSFVYRQKIFSLLWYNKRVFLLIFGGLKKSFQMVEEDTGRHGFVGGLGWRLGTSAGASRGGSRGGSGSTMYCAPVLRVSQCLT